MGGSEEGWGPATGARGAEKSKRLWDGKETVHASSGQFQGHVSTKEVKGQMSAADRELESALSASSEKMLGSNTLLNKLRAVGSTRFGEPLSSSATSSILLLIEDGADPRIAISFPSCRVWPFTQQIKPTKEF